MVAMRAVRGGGKVSLPDFQHGVGDPVEDAVQLAASHRIVLVEGNYVLLGAASLSPHPPPPPSPAPLIHTPTQAQPPYQSDICACTHMHTVHTSNCS